VSEPVAAIDCGTNSTRLLVADAGGCSVERLMRITRLGHGVDRTGELSPDAVARTVDVLREYRVVMDRHGARRVRVVATSAARDAANREDFFAAATEVVGVRPELLSGEEEGRLAFAGATAELDGTGAPYLVADIGGGSTEIVVGGSGGPEEVRTVVGAVSLDVGCVRVTERWLTSDPPTDAELAAGREAVKALLDDVSRDLPATCRAATLVGLAGTVAALAAVDQGVDTYDRDRVHHHVLERTSVEAILADLASLPAGLRPQRPGVEPARAEVIVGGAVVLAALMEHFGFESCLTSEADILDGLVTTLLD
jgi:exopolyphosphatase/guanosine-5'-triphosphate,3'-diphosphate pyrophosphatase